MHSQKNLIRDSRRHGRPSGSRLFNSRTLGGSPHLLLPLADVDRVLAGEARGAEVSPRHADRLDQPLVRKKIYARRAQELAHLRYRLAGGDEVSLPRRVDAVEIRG